MSMVQSGFKWNGSSSIDSLTYGYFSGSNKLYQVKDGKNDSLSMLGDFHFKGTQADTSYRYDGNGSLVKDLNKGIDTVVYNFLGMAQQVHIKGKGNINYIYDANGARLVKQVIDSTSRHATTTLYMNGLVYQQQDTITNPTGGVDTLQFLMHEEGKFRWALHYYQNGTAKYGWENDLFEKDHLGNTRVILTTQKDTSSYAATMEAAYRAKENALFYNIPQTSYSRTLAGYPVDLSMTNPNDSVIMLNGTVGRTQGPAIILKVMAGDTINVGAKSYYTSLSGTGTNPSITDVLTSLATGIVGVTGGSKGTVAQLNTINSPLYGALNSFITNKDGTIASKPRAYLNWMFLDDQYQYDATKSGALAVGNTTVGALTTLAQSGIVAAKNGFLYVWVSNETQGWPVYFDNLSVQVLSGPILEETHYYPFGLTMAGISDKALKGAYGENKYRYNSKELQNKEFSDGTGLEEYDYGARFQDPQLGMWHNIDPKSDSMRRFSPYNYGFDNPIRFIDPDGKAPRDKKNKYDNYYYDRQGNLLAVQRTDETQDRFYEVRPEDGISTATLTHTLSKGKNPQKTAYNRETDMEKVENVAQHDRTGGATDPGSGLLLNSQWFKIAVGAANSDNPKALIGAVKTPTGGERPIKQRDPMNPGGAPQIFVIPLGATSRLPAQDQEVQSFLREHLLLTFRLRVMALAPGQRL